MANLSDEALVMQVQKGNISAFEMLVNRWHKKLMFYAQNITKDRHTSDDIVQEALFSLYQTIDRVDTKKKFSSYLYSITRNTALTYLRKKKSQISLETITEIESDASLLENVSNNEKKQEIQSVLNKLPKKYQKILTLYYFKDLSYVEISKTMRMNINTVRTQLRRAKDMLKRHLIYEKVI